MKEIEIWYIDLYFCIICIYYNMETLFAYNKMGINQIILFQNKHFFSK